MKVRLPLTICLSVLSLACAHPRLTGSESPASTASAPAKSVKSAPAPIAAAHRVDFATHIQPILETHCQPCHFEGGQMYERLPFDRGETIVGLGEKLFSRIKDEGERGVIRGFLAQEGGGVASQPRSAPEGHRHVAWRFSARKAATPGSTGRIASGGWPSSTLSRVLNLILRTASDLAYELTGFQTHSFPSSGAERVA